MKILNSKRNDKIFYIIVKVSVKVKSLFVSFNLRLGRIFFRLVAVQCKSDKTLKWHKIDVVCRFSPLILSNYFHFLVGISQFKVWLSYSWIITHAHSQVKRSFFYSHSRQSCTNVEFTADTELTLKWRNK